MFNVNFNSECEVGLCESASYCVHSPTPARPDTNHSKLLSFHLPAAVAERGWDATPHGHRRDGHGHHRACKYHDNLVVQKPFHKGDLILFLKKNVSTHKAPQCCYCHFPFRAFLKVMPFYTSGSGGRGSRPSGGCCRGTNLLEASQATSVAMPKSVNRTIWHHC